MGQKSYVGIDLGASGGKTAVGIFDGKTLNIQDYLTFANPPVELPNALYWDVFTLYNSIVAKLSWYGSKYDGEISIGIDTWGASYGLLDQKGRLLEPVYHYRDIRTLDVEKELYKEVDKRKLFEMTGCQCNRTYTLPQLFSYSDEQKKILEYARTMLFLPDLLTYFLTGNISTEMTIAGTSCLMEYNQEKWNYELFKLFHLPTHILTDIVEPGMFKGNLRESVAKITGIKNGKLVSTVSHDSAAAVAAIPGFKKNKLYISIGTNISMGVERTESLITEKAFLGGFKNTGGIDKRKIVYRDFAAFWLINELRTQWSAEGKKYSFEELIMLGKNTKSKKSVIDVEYPTFNNAGGDMKHKINQYLKQTNQEILETDGEYVLCVLESIVLRIKFCADYIKNELEIPFDEAMVINGGSRNDLLVQMIADALKVVVKAGLPYATLSGNIMTQLCADGEVSGVEEMRNLSSESFEMNEYYPMEGYNWEDALGEARHKNICY